MDQHTEQAQFQEQLLAFTRQHRAGHWTGSFSQFMEQVLPASPCQFARSSHQYIWDMLRWSGKQDEDGKLRCSPVSYTHLTLPTILLV